MERELCLLQASKEGMEVGKTAGTCEDNIVFKGGKGPCEKRPVATEILEYGDAFDVCTL